jgi:tRNA-dihydrouridine synthase
MAGRLRRETALAGLMIGRAALGYPWIFRELKAGIDGQPPPPPPTLAERWGAMLRYTDERLALEGRDPATASLGGLRAMFKSMVKEMPEASALRCTLERVRTREELDAAARAHLAKWES